MRQIIYICDGCQKRIKGAICQRGDVEGEFCTKCVRTEEACPHEDNISDATNGKATARLICKACGYDRVVAVEETLTV